MENKKLPDAPEHRGVDPLANGKTYHGFDSKTESAKARKNKKNVDATHNDRDRTGGELVSDQAETTTGLETAPVTEQPDETGEVTNPPKSTPEKTAETTKKK